MQGKSNIAKMDEVRSGAASDHILDACLNDHSRLAIQRALTVEPAVVGSIYSRELHPK
jgi:hypothetical protein